MKVTFKLSVCCRGLKAKVLRVPKISDKPGPESPKFVKSTNVTFRDGRNLCNPQPVWERAVRGEGTPRSGRPALPGPGHGTAQGGGRGSGVGAARPPPGAKALGQHRCTVLISTAPGDWRGPSPGPGTPGTTPVPGDPAVPRDPLRLSGAGTAGSFPKPGPTVRDPRQLPGTPGRLPV